VKDVALLNPQEDHQTARALIEIVRGQKSSAEASLLRTQCKDFDRYNLLFGKVSALNTLLAELEAEYQRRTHR
jgi:hypothetical protein